MLTITNSDLYDADKLKAILHAATRGEKVLFEETECTLALSSSLSADDIDNITGAHISDSIVVKDIRLRNASFWGQTQFLGQRYKLSKMNCEYVIDVDLKTGSTQKLSLSITNGSYPDLDAMTTEERDNWLNANGTAVESQPNCAIS